MIGTLSKKTSAATTGAITHAAETARDGEICSRCGLPVDNDSQSNNHPGRCSCGFTQRAQQGSQSPEYEGWSDIT